MARRMLVCPRCGQVGAYHPNRRHPCHKCKSWYMHHVIAWRLGVWLMNTGRPGPQVTGFVPEVATGARR